MPLSLIRRASLIIIFAAYVDACHAAEANIYDAMALLRLALILLRFDIIDAVSSVFAMIC